MNVWRYSKQREQELKAQYLWYVRYQVVRTETPNNDYEAQASHCFSCDVKQLCVWRPVAFLFPSFPVLIYSVIVLPCILSMARSQVVGMNTCSHPQFLPSASIHRTSSLCSGGISEATWRKYISFYAVSGAGVPGVNACRAKIVRKSETKQFSAIFRTMRTLIIQG